MSSGLGKGIGIPVKLLHEAEGHTVTVRPLLDSILDARTRASAARSRGRARASPSLSGGRDRAASRRKKTYSFFIFVRGDRRSILPPSLPRNALIHPPRPTRRRARRVAIADRAQERRDVPRHAPRVGGQLELPTRGHHADGQRRPREPTGARVHSRKQDPVPSHSGHAEERADV